MVAETHIDLYPHAPKFVHIDCQEQVKILEGGCLVEIRKKIGKHPNNKLLDTDNKHHITDEDQMMEQYMTIHLPTMDHSCWNECLNLPLPKPGQISYRQQPGEQRRKSIPRHHIHKHQKRRRPSRYSPLVN